MFTWLLHNDILTQWLCGINTILTQYLFCHISVGFAPSNEYYITSGCRYVYCILTRHDNHNYWIKTDFYNNQGWATKHFEHYRKKSYCEIPKVHNIRLYTHWTMFRLHVSVIATAYVRHQRKFQVKIHDFQTWPLIGWQHSRQPIRDQVKKSSLIKHALLRGFLKKVFFRSVMFFVVNVSHAYWITWTSSRLDGKISFGIFS